MCSASARSSRSSRTRASRLPSVRTEAISALPSGSSRASSSMRSSSADSGLRSWWEASATKARCCSRTSSTLSAISLNERARRRSSGGPAVAATRAFIRPVAMSWLAASRTRTGRSTQPVRRKAAATATSMAADSPAAISSQPRRTWERICAVGESVMTTATTSPSRMTGEATGIGRFVPGPDLVRVVAAAAGQRLAEGLAPSPSRGRAIPAGRRPSGCRRGRRRRPGCRRGRSSARVRSAGCAPRSSLCAAAAGRRDELGEGGEAGGVVDPVDDHPLLLRTGHADGQREAEREQHAGHEDDEQREQSGAHAAARRPAAAGPAPAAGTTRR